MGEAMKYRIKNKTLKKAIFAFFDEESVMQSIAEQMNDGSNFIQLTNRSASWKNAFLNRELSDICSLETRFYFNKTEIETVAEFNPGRWNPFPAVRPPKYKNYLVQLLYTTGERILVTANWTPLGYWVRHAGKHDRDSAYADNPDIVAFRELPDFYESEKQE